MTAFALVHGGGHGGWCWELVVPALLRRGHTAVTPDLPIGDPSAGAQRWAEAVVDALDEEGAEEDVVVVGHSLGGMAVPVVATMRPIRRMVFLGALIPVPGLSFLEHMADEPGAVKVFPSEIPGEQNASGVSWEGARDRFFHDLPEPLARRAWERLRPTARTILTERCPIDRWPDVPSTSIIMTDDRMVDQAWSRKVAQERIGAEVVELPGGHSPFLSRPSALADVLSAI